MQGMGKKIIACVSSSIPVCCSIRHGERGLRRGRVCLRGRENGVSCAQLPRHRPKISCYTRYVARQPILTADESASATSCCSATECRIISPPPTADRLAEHAGFVHRHRLHVMCDGRRRSSIAPAEEFFVVDVVVESPGSGSADDAVIAACRRLKQAGYMIARTSRARPCAEPLTPFADLIKVDMKGNSALRAPRFSAGPGGGEGGKPPRSPNSRLARLHLLPGIFFPPAGAHANPRDSRQSAELSATAGGAAGAGCQRVENVIKGEASLRHRPAALLELAAVRTDLVRRATRWRCSANARYGAWICLAATLVVGQSRSSDLLLVGSVPALFL